jgi:DNA-directed DNA polymerase III PolC
MNSFVHLQCHSAYSFLWGTYNPEDLVKAAHSIHQNAVALTDFGLYGAIKFYRSALEENLQPIIGATITIWDDSPIVLLCKNTEGYRNLCKLISIVFEGSTVPKNRLTKQNLYHWNSGLIFLIGGENSLFYNLVKENQSKSAQNILQELRDLIPDPESLYLNIQNHSFSEEENKLQHRQINEIRNLAQESQIPVVATNAVTFLKPEDYLIHRAFVAIQTRHHHRNIKSLPNNSFYLKSESEIFQKIPYKDAIENTARIAFLCKSFSLPLRKLHPPVFQDYETANTQLIKMGYRELARNVKNIEISYIRQIEHELNVISKLKLSDFFLLVREIIDFARKRGIRHSIRGSAAGSLIVYLLLGGVDPLEHNLLFERFINEGRGDMPDIDIDFDSDRRDEIIHYVMDKFPRQTTMVCTILSFKARSAVRLTARALGYPLNEISKLAECLPWSLRGNDLEEALNKLPELKDSPIKNDKRLMHIASKIVGLPHQSSVHLGGVIIAPENIKYWTPVGTSSKGLPVGQLDKDDVDILGLMKLDILGLRMHTAIRKALEVLWRDGISLDLNRTRLDDDLTYKLLRTTDSVGIFQLESPGQRNLLGRLQPRQFSDLIAEISLFRPGPVEGNIVDPYVRRRNNQEKVHNIHKNLESIVSETYGVIVFQEQVLRIVHKFAGLTYAQADAFRRAMTKDRYSDKMTKLKDQFIQGATKNGYSKELTEKVYQMVAAFASFGFCKAHAASFAHITYQSAYLKAHHPQAFYIGLLNAGHVGSYPPRVILNEARRKDIPIYPPDINESGLEYKPEDSGIRVPLDVIKGVGPAMARRIISEREKRGLFTTRNDFISRLDLPDQLMSVLDLAGSLENLESSWNLVQEVCNV